MFIDPFFNFRYSNAKEFVDRISSNAEDENLYLFFGKTDPWVDENVPDDSKISDSNVIKAWDSMSGLKKVLANDIFLSVRKINWFYNEVYDEYSDKKDLRELDYYVLTSENNIYKCISNNNGVPSTIMPTHITDDIIEEDDGYKWKYMCSVPASLLIKFSINEYIPLPKNVLTQTQTVYGRSFDHLDIDTTGIGYPANKSLLNGNEIPVFISGNGSQEDSATATINTVNGIITSVILLNSGSNYAYAPQENFPVAFRQKTSTGIIQNAFGVATADPSGNILTARVIVGGSGYDSSIPVNIIQSSCEGYIETDNVGTIIKANIYTGRTGSDFTHGIANIISATGSGGRVIPVLSPEGGHGSNIYKELQADYIMINQRLDSLFAADYITNSEFRKYGLIYNPLDFETTEDIIMNSDDEPIVISEHLPITAIKADAKHRIVLAGTNTNFVESEKIYGLTSGATGIQTSKYGAQELRLNIDDSISDIEFIEGEEIIGEISEASGIIDSIIEPDVQKYSGLIIHINNISPITNIPNSQFITITIVLKY